MPFENETGIRHNQFGYFCLADLLFAYPAPPDVSKQVSDRLTLIGQNPGLTTRLIQGLDAALSNLGVGDTLGKQTSGARQELAVRIRLALHYAEGTLERPFREVGKSLPRLNLKGELVGSEIGVANTTARTIYHKGILRLRINSEIDPVAGFRFGYAPLG